MVGCAAHGWSRIDLESGPFEPLAAVVLVEEGQVEVTTATELAAETTRWWLERVASDLVEHLIGRVSAEETRILVPAIWPLEVANVLLVAERNHRLSMADTSRFLDLVGALARSAGIRGSP